MTRELEVKRRSLLLFALPAFLGLATPAGGQNVFISEFLAVNEGSLRDEDGATSDWIELHNAEPAAVDLDGWFLTDLELERRKWRFPSVTLEAGGYLVVFASGKDRAFPGDELHTDFRLNGGGEYLALVRPDGSVAHEFAPFYPTQRIDISYGLSSEVTPFVEAGGPVDYLVPADGSLEGLWTGTEFAPGVSWKAGRTGVGFDAGGGPLATPPAVSYWSFDGGVLDEVGPNDGVYFGGASPSFVEGFDGRSGGAIRFDGSDDYVDVRATSFLPAYNRPAYTVAMWVKGLPQNDKRVYSEGSSRNNSPLFTIGTDRTGNTGKVDIFIRTDGGSTIVSHRLSSGIAFDGEWHHIAWVDEGGRAALYIDGARDPQNFDYSQSALSLDITSIGSVLRSSACCFFSGSIDDVAVWDTALTAAEVTTVAGGASPGDGSLYSALIATDVEADLRGVNSSIYLRVPFAVEDPALLDSLTLSMKYDDGFVAYLGGVELARRNAPGQLAWNSTAGATHSGPDAVAYEHINVTAGIGALTPGMNVLAIQGLNRSAGDETFLVLPELVASGARILEERYFAEPSPGAPNQGGTIDFVADTRFSVDRGFFEAPFLLEISSATDGAVIRYTLDTSAPSATRGTVYTGPLLIDGTTVVRAAAFKASFEPTNVDTQTYLFADDVIRQPAAPPPGYPSVWQGFRADYAMDPEVCLNENSPHFAPTIRDDLESLPVLSLVVERDDLFGRSRGIYTHSTNRGRAWERPASAELFFPDGSQEGFQIDCGVRMQGGSSARPGEGKHAFRLLFKAEYGATKLRYQLFPDSPVDRFDTIVLRCFSTDSWHFKDGGSRYRRWDSQFIRDLWMKDSQLAMGHLSGHNIYVHLYVNGLYWGVYNPAERPDDSFNAEHQGGEKEEWDVMKDFAELFRGNRQAWEQLMSQARAGLGSQAAYQRVQGNNPDGTRNPALPVLVDVDNIIDYMMLHIFAGAEDWPHHNWYAARNRTGELGGWRFFVWDQEIVMDFVFRNRVNVTNDNSPSRVYASLRANPEFRLRFADRVQKHLFAGGALTVEASRDRWMRRAAQIDRAVVAESARWGDYRMDVPDPRNAPATLYNREEHWLVERDKVLEEYIPESRRLALGRFEAAGLYPSVEPPVLNQVGGRIPPGFRLSLTTGAGTVYYTLDGSDPRLPGGAIAPEALAAGAAGAVTVLSAPAPARILVPGNGGLGLAWTERDFDDSGWDAATTGVGYERSSGYDDHIVTDVEAAMYSTNSSIYIRVPFEVEDPAAFAFLVLRMKYDDGFVATINGREAARANAPASPAWNSLATASHPDGQAVLFLNFDASQARDALRPGRNVLAIHGLNASVTSSDMLIVPELAAGSVTESAVELTGTTQVKARTLLGGEWSALVETIFFIDRPLDLRVTELMYHPPALRGDPFGADEYEFAELQNVGSEPLALTGVRLTGGVDFAFPRDHVVALGPGEVVLLVKNLAAFESRYDTAGLNIAGEYTGRLNNARDSLRLEGPFGETVLDFFYDDAWYTVTDGRGSSLVVADAFAPPAAWATRENWRPSVPLFGSPGTHELGPPPDGGLQAVGDANQDGSLDISDAIALLRHLFAGAVLPAGCEGAFDQGANLALLDPNGDGTIDLSDPIFLLSYLFTAGPAPALGSGCVRISGCPDVCLFE